MYVSISIVESSGTLASRGLESIYYNILLILLGALREELAALGIFALVIQLTGGCSEGLDAFGIFFQHL